MGFEQIRCADIRPDPRRGVPARDFGPLADSIRMYGVLRPVLLRATADGYTIVHGERRWRAARMAGLQTIPAMIVQDFSRDDGASAGGAAADSASQVCNSPA